MKFSFDNHILDTDLRELRRDRELVAMQPQVFDLLLHLSEEPRPRRQQGRSHRVGVARPDRLGFDAGSRINAARKAIGDNGKEQRLIRTIARKGVRFVGSVNARTRGEQSAAVADIEQRAALTAERPAIAVLPFMNTSGEPEQEYFSDGIAEDIITELSRLRWFLVIARNSSFAYKGKAGDLGRSARNSGVGYVVEGSVRQERRSRPHHRAAQRRRDRQASSGRSVTTATLRRLRHPGRDHRGGRGRNRAAGLRR